MTSASREFIRSVRSMSSAVTPPTWTWPASGVPFVGFGDHLVAQRADERLACSARSGRPSGVAERDRGVARRSSGAAA